MVSYGAEIAPETALSKFIAPDSRERLQLLIQQSSGGASHSILQTAAGVTLEVHFASEAGRVLVLGAATPAGIRDRCAALQHEAGVEVLARRILEGATPDTLTIDLWSELARVNNELATAHRQLAKNNAELRWMNEQKNQLLGMAAHDLRNPLAAVLGYSFFVLASPATLTPEQERMLRRIRVNVETMLAMVEDVLDFSAIESGTVRLDPAELVLEELVHDVVETNFAIAEAKQIRIGTMVDSGMPPIVGDRRKLTQVVNNLVTNAIKFSHPDSEVTIAAGLDAKVGVRLSVSDRGLGMTTEQKARLFEPFAKIGVEATAGEKSTGLGLAIVRRIVEAHRGRVEVESEAGRGTTFTVVLPLSCAVVE